MRWPISMIQNASFHTIPELCHSLVHVLISWLSRKLQSFLWPPARPRQKYCYYCLVWYCSCMFWHKNYVFYRFQHIEKRTCRYWPVYWSSSCRLHADFWPSWNLYFGYFFVVFSLFLHHNERKKPFMWDFLCFWPKFDQNWQSSIVTR